MYSLYLYFQEFYPIKTKIFSFVLAILFSLAEICFFFAIDAIPATSIVGTDPLDKNLFVLPESNPSKSPAKRFVKQLSSTWAEHKNILLEYCAGSKSERCRQTKRTHFYRTTVSFGKQCIVFPGASPVFVQDVLLGPPATQLVLQRRFLFKFESSASSELPSSILMIRIIHVRVLFFTSQEVIYYFMVARLLSHA